MIREWRVWRAQRKLERERQARQRSCHWHTHSMFGRCCNGLTAAGYYSLCRLERLLGSAHE